MKMRIVVTGADGFIGRNLCVRLRELGHADVQGITRGTSPSQWVEVLAHADFVFHLAGVNRPPDPGEFATGNAGLTQTLCAALSGTGRKIPVALASSTQATLDNPYGLSKRAAEEAILAYGRQTGARVYVLRLTNVFGKWCRPNYNSAVATFCHNVAHGLPIAVNDPKAPLRLIHIDDVMSGLIDLLAVPEPADSYVATDPIYDTTVGEVAGLLQEFSASRQSLVTPRVGTGLVRALYTTFISYMPPDFFSYQVPSHRDPRGEFVEMLKTPDAGQFSYFTAHPGITRGEHYHHSKTEKFLVIRGTARFGFRHIDTHQTHELIAQGGSGQIVETVPGWTHNITNIGDDELIVMLWANEIFDRNRPDTVTMKVKP